MPVEQAADGQAQGRDAGGEDGHGQDDAEQVAHARIVLKPEDEAEIEEAGDAADHGQGGPQAEEAAGRERLRPGLAPQSGEEGGAE
ncbi:hypothetical protein D3C84_1229650 [compost metagenome]